MTIDRHGLIHELFRTNILMTRLREWRLVGGHEITEASGTVTGSIFFSPQGADVSSWELRYHDGHGGGNVA